MGARSASTRQDRTRNYDHPFFSYYRKYSVTPYARTQDNLAIKMIVNSLSANWRQPGTFTKKKYNNPTIYFSSYTRRVAPYHNFNKLPSSLIHPNLCKCPHRSTMHQQGPFTTFISENLSLHQVCITHILTYKHHHHHQVSTVSSKQL